MWAVKLSAVLILLYIIAQSCQAKEQTEKRGGTGKLGSDPEVEVKVEDEDDSDDDAGASEPGNPGSKSKSDGENMAVKAIFMGLMIAAWHSCSNSSDGTICLHTILPPTVGVCARQECVELKFPLKFPSQVV